MSAARPENSLWVVGLAAAGLVFLGCDRGETSRSNTPAETNGGYDSRAPLSAGASSAGASSGGSAASPLPTPSCVVPTPSQPPPNAEPASQCPVAPTPGPALERGFVTFADAPGAPRVSVELAQSDADRAYGLMYRTELARDEGMLFSWTNQEIRRFWMRNTCIPLDMLFIAADGTIVGILEQVPVLNQASRSVPCPAQHVLEVNAGWTRQNGVSAGQRVLIDR